MCTYNGEMYLREQLESIANQTWAPSEVVICDDRSTDTTLSIAQTFAKTAPFPVKLHLNEVNLGGAAKGITRNFERAVGLCTGDLICTSDQDDVWLPEKVATMVQRMEADPQLGGVFSDAELISADGEAKGTLLSHTIGLTAEDQKRLARGEGLPVPLAMNKVYGSSLMFDARLVEKILPVPPHWWFDAWVGTMVTVHAKLAFIAKPLFLYRIHANQNHGASLPTASERVKQWRRSAKDYWQDSEPRLVELYARIEAENNPQLEPSLEYLRGRMALLQSRAEFSSNRMYRVAQVLREMPKYHRYFNGWKSIVKDLSA
jgi:glycosyltransferase involved in cell wall biosynthesis